MVNEQENCALCGCKTHRNGNYAKPNIEGRSHATSHHCVAERFFGKSRNKAVFNRKRIFKQCPWENKNKKITLCYECHELLLHNPVLLLDDVELFAKLIKKRNLSESSKPEKYKKIAGRIELFHEIIEAGLKAMWRKR